MVFRIAEFDRDYRTITDRFVKEFKDENEARKWCRENSWTGYHYFIVD